MSKTGTFRSEAQQTAAGAQEKAFGWKGCDLVASLFVSNTGGQCLANLLDEKTNFSQAPFVEQKAPDERCKPVEKSSDGVGQIQNSVLLFAVSL